MTAERPLPRDDEEVGFVLALTLPLVAGSDSPVSGGMPPEFATHLSTFDPDAALFAQATPVAPGLGAPPKPPR